MTMAVLFLSLDGRCRESWSEAFPDLKAVRYETLPAVPADTLVWALLPGGQAADQLVRHLRKALPGRPLVILADEPSDEDALAALAVGAVGYCNGHAAPEVLQQVALAVRHGGVWVGQGLMQRLLGATARVLPKVEVPAEAWRERLTARELETALLIARGANNKEIARELGITERTVKAHVSAMLEKLGARDRLQLSLIINGVEPVR